MIKKIILKAGFFSAISVSAFAQSIPDELLRNPNTPVVTIGGFINPVAAVRKQSAAYSQDRLPDSIELGGNVNTSLGTTDATKQAVLGTSNRQSSPVDLVNDSEIYIKVGAISDSGLKYGAIVELEADTSPNGRGNGFNADKSFVFTESRFGKFEFGNNMAANQKMKVGPSLFARAAGGINGKYLEFINLPMLANGSHVSDPICNGGVGIDNTNSSITTIGSAATACANVKLPRFILIPQSPVAHGGYAKGFYNRASDTDYSNDDWTNYGSFNRNSLANVLNSSNTNSLTNNGQTNGLNIKNGSFGQMEDATKASFYTPRVNGLQFGASFTANSNNNGTSATISGKDSGGINNILSWGLNYSENFGNLGFAWSATGEHGQFQNSKLPSGTGVSPVIRYNLDSYDTGIMMTYFGFTIGASYGYWGNSLQATSGIYSCDYNISVALDQQNCVGSNAGKKFNGANYYTGGLAYEFGPVAASLTYMKSQFQKNQYQATSFGIDYKLARGLMPYIEVTKFDFAANRNFVGMLNTTGGTAITSNSQLMNNKGYVGLMGILFSF